MTKTFRALLFEQIDDQVQMNLQQLTIDDLPEEEVTIQVAYSSVNYKDGLGTIPNRTIRHYPMIPGIDLAGTVLESRDARFSKGDEVIVTSYELGISHPGGFSEIARVPAKWVVPLPKGLTLKESMIIGTAGFTAALSVQRLEESGLTPKSGPVLVTGATGGVGSIAVDILSTRGYEVIASTGKEHEHDYLRQLGASQIINRKDLQAPDKKPMRKQLWAGVVDPVGGSTLEYALTTTQYGGSVAVSGLTGGGDVHTTVYPFILRGVNLLGIDSVYCPMEIREKLWNRLASDLRPGKLHESIVQEITLEEIPETLHKILRGEIRGRTIVKL
ncbi:NADPH:quinone oxidoreductase family protein [Brevibacillus daliensis]|uniref:NADPH:quinone oxidoreductase family protein n=1 Tax=Brevibacillus daliensis TaxID=2892995 RepID=UPI001E5C4A69|nr:acryloyl-CoA reductase [Brevibacillus daliensis]